MDPLAIATCLRELALYKRLDGDAHRARAYDKAAGTVEAVHDLDKRIAAETLTELPNIGDSIAKLIGELARTGHAPALDAMRAKWPVTVVELAQLDGVGVVKARKLVEALEPEGLDELMAMAEAGRIEISPDSARRARPRSSRRCATATSAARSGCSPTPRSWARRSRPTSPAIPR